MSKGSKGDQPVECRIELNETWLKSMENRFQNHCLSNHLKRNGAQQPAPTIFKVLSSIRQANREAFEPQIISFGPCHRGKRRLKSMEEQKWRYLRKFLARNPNKGLRDYLIKIKSMVDQARRCYWDEVLMDDNSFVEMLVLDGIMIVELMLMRQEQQPEDGQFDPVVRTMWTLPLIVYDMLKLENQVPFFVLKILYEIVMDVGASGEKAMFDLAFNFIYKNLSEYIVIENPPQKPEIHHILHFFHSCIIQGQTIRRRRRFWYRGNIIRAVSSLKNMLSRAVSQKLTVFGHVNPDAGEESSNPTRDVDSIPTAQELKEAGINFKRKKEGGFLDVTFSAGVIEMTPLVVNEETSTVFHNLIAFEQCYPCAGNHVTGYCVFLDCLIDTPDDVALLRQNRVIENKLGSDKEAALLFNRLCCHVAIDDHQLSKMFIKVEHYCRSSWPRWRARLAHEYFGNPWAIVSVVAAVVLLFLTGVQTALSIIAYIWPSNNGPPTSNH